MIAHCLLFSIVFSHYTNGSFLAALSLYFSNFKTSEKEVGREKGISTTFVLSLSSFQYYTVLVTTPISVCSGYLHCSHNFCHAPFLFMIEHKKRRKQILSIKQLRNTQFEYQYYHPEANNSVLGQSQQCLLQKRLFNMK